MSISSSSVRVTEFADFGLVDGAVERDDFLDPAFKTGGKDDDFLARADPAGGDLPGVATEVLIRPQNILHRISKIHVVLAGADVDVLEMVQQRRAIIPGHLAALGDDIVAGQRRHRDQGDVLRIELRDETRKLVHDALVDRFVVVDQIHFVDGDDDMRNAQQRGDKGVPLGLRLHTFTGIDQNDRQLGRRSAGHHIAGVLDMPGRVGDDELASRRGEIAVGDVDGDLLLTLGAQAVGEQSEVDVARRRGRGWFARPARSGLRTATWYRKACARSACSCRRRRCRQS